MKLSRIFSIKGRRGKFLQRATALLLVVATTVSCAPVVSAEEYTSGVGPTYDEAYYGTLDYYGNLTNGSVVKTYVTNGAKTITDYGNYTSVENLTDSTEPQYSDGVTTFSFADGEVPSHFYFEGYTDEPFKALPWNVSMTYKLNGVTADAEDLAGKTGMVEVDLNIVPNPDASEYARNNYTLEAVTAINQNNILSLEQEGGQVQLIGNLRSVLFVALPGEEQHFKLWIGADSFEFPGFTFLYAPATLSQLDKIADLQDKKTDLENDYNALSGSIDSTLNALQNMTGSLNSSAAGLDELNQARGTISEGKGTVYDDADVTNADLANLADAIDPLYQEISDASQALSSSKSATQNVIDTLDSTKDELGQIKDLLKDVSDDTGDVKTLIKHTQNLKTYLDNLADAISDLDDVTVNTSSSSSGVSISDVESLISVYNNLKNNTDSGTSTLTALTKAKLVDTTTGKFTDTATVIGALVNSNAQLAALSDPEKQALISGVTTAITAGSSSGLAEPALTLYNSYTKLNSLLPYYLIYEKANGGSDPTFKQFTKTLLLAQGKSESAAEQSASTAAFLYFQSNNGEDISGLDALIKQLNGTIDSSLSDSVSQLNNNIDSLKSPSSSLLKKLGNICDELDAVNALLDDATDISDVSSDTIDKIDSLIDSISDLNDVISDYEPQAQDLLSTIQTLSTKSATSLRNLSKLFGDTEALARRSGDQLDQGTKDTLSSLADSLRKTADALATSRDVQDAKNTIDGIIRRIWDDHTGDLDNLLNMDNTLSAQSLTSDKNATPTSVQVLIRSQEIKVDDSAQKEAEADAIENTTFWDRVITMFKDIGAAVVNAFS